MNANVQPGDSGGAVVDTQGRVIGLITAANPGFGFGFRAGSGAQSFAIPIDEATAAASQMVAGHGSATVHIGPSAFLGVQLSSGFFGSGGSGVTVGGVLSGQPAARAGLAAGDVIISIDGRSVGSADEIGSLMFAHHPGDTVKVTWTDTTGQTQTASIRLASGPPA